MRVISESQKVELDRLEKIIAKGIKAFVEVGNALKYIRDNDLYFASHRTFEAYCKDKWSFSRSYVHRLIDAAGVVDNVVDKTLPIGNIAAPPTESHARELDKAPPEQQAEIWQEVVESHPKPTARDVKAAVDRRKQAAPKPEPIKGEIVKDDEPEIEAEEWEDVEEEYDDEPEDEPEEPTGVFVSLRSLFDSMEPWQQEQAHRLWSEWMEARQ